MGTGSNYPLVAAYSLDSSGNMTAVNGSPITVGNVGGEYALLLAVSPNGQYLYISDGNSFLESAKINSDGSLTAVSNTYLAADTTVNDMVVGTSGEYLYMSSAFGGVVAVQLNADGSMSEVAGSPFDLKLNSTPTSIYLAPSGNYLYTVLTNDPGNAFGSIQVDSIAATGVPQAVNGSPFPVGAFPLGFTTNPAGSFAYVPDIEQNVPQYPDRMRGFSIDSSTGTFAQLSGFSDDYLLNSNVTLTGFLGTAVDPSGSYLYAASGWVTPSGDLPEGIMGYSVNSTSGLITPLPGFPITEPAGAYQILFAQFK
jgi:6-phosphogluconolactonase (cycloisomerase 2 family)